VLNPSLSNKNNVSFQIGKNLGFQYKTGFLVPKTIYFISHHHRVSFLLYRYHHQCVHNLSNNDYICSKKTACAVTKRKRSTLKR